MLQHHTGRRLLGPRRARLIIRGEHYQRRQPLPLRPELRQQGGVLFSRQLAVQPDQQRLLAPVGVAQQSQPAQQGH